MDLGKIAMDMIDWSIYIPSVNKTKERKSFCIHVVDYKNMVCRKCGMPMKKILEEHNDKSDD